jgi:hypothetical protein
MKVKKTLIILGSAAWGQRPELMFLVKGDFIQRSRSRGADEGRRGFRGRLAEEVRRAMVQEGLSGKGRERSCRRVIIFGQILGMYGIHGWVGCDSCGQIVGMYGVNGWVGCDSSGSLVEWVVRGGDLV